MTEAMQPDRLSPRFWVLVFAVLATASYALAFKAALVAFVLLGMGFELAFWVTLFRAAR